MLDRQRLRTFVLGGIAGALAGVLLAPKSGKELRGSLKERAGEAREKSRESYFDAQERMQERVSRKREGRGSFHDGEAGAEKGPEEFGPIGPAPEPMLGGHPEEPFIETPAGDPSPPPLRDVSREESAEDPVSPDAVPPDAEELRRRIRDIRSRLRPREPREERPGFGDGPRDG